MRSTRFPNAPPRMSEKLERMSQSGSRVRQYQVTMSNIASRLTHTRNGLRIHSGNELVRLKAAAGFST